MFIIFSLNNLFITMKTVSIILHVYGAYKYHNSKRHNDTYSCTKNEQHEYYNQIFSNVISPYVCSLNRYFFITLFYERYVQLIWELNWNSVENLISLHNCLFSVFINIWINSAKIIQKIYSKIPMKVIF